MRVVVSADDIGRVHPILRGTGSRRDSGDRYDTIEEMKLFEGAISMNRIATDLIPASLEATR